MKTIRDNAPGRTVRKWTLRLAGACSLALAAISATAAPALAAPPVSVPEIRLTGLKAWSGRSLTAFYVASYRPAFSQNGSQPQVRAITAPPVRFTIPASGELTIPAKEIRHPGTELTNLLIFAVHSPAMRALYLRNADQSVPRDPRLSDPDSAKSLSQQDFETDALGRLPLREIQDGGPVAVPFNSLSH